MHICTDICVGPPPAPGIPRAEAPAEGLPGLQEGAQSHPEEASGQPQRNHCQAARGMKRMRALLKGLAVKRSALMKCTCQSREETHDQ